MSEKKETYEVVTFEDPETGDLILPIPEELLKKMNWQPGDQLSWNKTDTGAWVLSKK